ncbi:MAG: hypothetical protein ACTJHU_10430 [Mycetocola sp.]
MTEKHRPKPSDIPNGSSQDPADTGTGDTASGGAPEEPDHSSSVS